MKVSIYSRETVENLLREGIPPNTAIISFYDPPTTRTPKGYKPVDYSGIANPVMQIPLHDIDIEILGEYGLTLDTYFPEAQALAAFIRKANADGNDILCQCEYGQSRSAACAAAILEYYHRTGITIFADYRYYPNQLVFNKLYDALCGKNNSLKKMEDNE